jgi:hypothetical protein
VNRDYKLIYPKFVAIPMSTRWERAQEAEKKFWLNATIDDGKEYWSEMLLHGFGTTFDIFCDKDVLDVGCGPNGLIYYLQSARSRVGLDPLDMTGRSQ